MAKVPIPDTNDDLLAECDVETMSAGTKGGQRANKVETGVRLTHRPTGVRVQSRSSRSQFRNKALAVATLRERLEEMNRPVKVRRPTKPTRGSKRRRIEAKKRRSEKKANRQKPDW
ncbi:peptide chain release factor-like protein [Rubrivirga sp. S365]|uniref:Peptide chain release factor-like protein n=1 Tax=Rubrivirga litoralis TaxID=3075598 RepID=A0ABU3BLZ1_9BACT|nr:MULTISPECIES: peptide chain release factor-like protein [unclassified Rubrivirga]MDT0630312.1 peptide chain release factor-like protein [Rubrivirga sp. F394]MDT7855824.1 peptide chain release factor-like protein [Rubrivirga sp. S365]